MYDTYFIYKYIYTYTFCSYKYELYVHSLVDIKISKDVL